jgi:hypothetical protein
MITDHRGSDQIKDARTRMSQSIHTLQQQEPGEEFDDVMGMLDIQPCSTASQKGKGNTVEFSPAPAPAQNNGMNLDKDNTQQRDKDQQNTVINEDNNSDNPAEANGAEQVDTELSPAKEAAACKVKIVYKLKRLRAQEEKRAEECKKKLKEEATKSMRLHNEKIASIKVHTAEHLRDMEWEYNHPLQAAVGTSNRTAAPTARTKEAQKSAGGAGAPRPRLRCYACGIHTHIFKDCNSTLMWLSKWAGQRFFEAPNNICPC